MRYSIVASLLNTARRTGKQTQFTVEGEERRALSSPPSVVRCGSRYRTICGRAWDNEASSTALSAKPSRMSRWSPVKLGPSDYLVDACHESQWGGRGDAFPAAIQLIFALSRPSLIALRLSRIHLTGFTYLHGFTAENATVLKFIRKAGVPLSNGSVLKFYPEG